MMQAEQEARRRGCRYARLATGNYQAPDFYPKLGYVLYGTLENCPAGVTVYYFYKELTRLGLPFYKSEANFILFDTKRKVEDVNVNLLKKGIILRPVQNYGFKTLMRMTVGQPIENQKAIEAIEKMLQEVKEL